MEVFELFLRDGHIVVWPGQTGTDAAERYIARVGHPVVVGYRQRLSGIRPRYWHADPRPQRQLAHLAYLRSVAQFDQNTARFQDWVTEFQQRYTNGPA